MDGLMRGRSVSTGSTDVSVSVPSDVQPGAFFLAQITGASWRSRAVSAGQAFVRAGTRFTHTGLYVGQGRIVHADLGRGVVEDDFTQRYGHRQVLWSDAPVQRHLADPGRWIRQGGYEARLRQRVVDSARSLVGADYAWLEYLAIAGAEFRWPGTERLRGFIDARGQVICSGLVDRAYQLAGIHLFSDRRRSGDVTPADLAFYDECWVRERLASLERRIATIEEQLR